GCQRGRSSLFVLFFFSSRRRHTRFSRDWSSDVCSSDLFFDRHSRSGQILLNAAAHGGNGVAKCVQAIKLGVVAKAVPQRVIFILLASTGIYAGGLQMTILQMADPYIFPSRRNSKLLDPLEYLFVANFPFAQVVAENLPFFPSTDAWLRILHINQLYR